MNQEPDVLRKSLFLSRKSGIRLLDSRSLKDLMKVVQKLEKDGHGFLFYKDARDLWVCVVGINIRSEISCEHILSESTTYQVEGRAIGKTFKAALADALCSFYNEEFRGNR